MPVNASFTARRRNGGLALAGFAFLVTMFGTTLPTPLYPLYQRQFDLSELTITLIYAVYAAGVIGALILVGRWSDQLGRRRVMFGACAFSAASAVLFLTDAGVGILFLGRVLSGISAGIATGTATAMIVELAPESRRARATLVATAVNMGGLGLGPLVGGLFAEYAPLPLHLIFVLDLVLLVGAIIAVYLAPETVAVATRLELRPQRLSVPAEVRGVFIPACIAGFAGFAVLGLFTAVAPAFLGEILQLPNLALTGFVVFLAFAASTCGQFALGRVPQHAAMPIGCIILAVGALLVGAGIGVGSLGFLLPGAIVAGCGQGLSFRAGIAAVTAASPATRRGEITSTFFVVLYIALSIPVIGIGIAADSAGLRVAGVVFALAVALLSLAALAALLLLRRR